MQQLKDIKTKHFLHFQAKGDAAWQNLKEAYAAKVHKYWKEAHEKTMWKEHSRKEGIEKEAHTLAFKEKIIKSARDHNTKIKNYNLQVHEHNNKIDLCKVRRNRNSDVIVLRAHDSAFVSAEQPQQAVSAQPQNPDFKDKLFLQKDWRNSFVKFPLFHQKGRREEEEFDEDQSTLGETNSTDASIARNKTDGNKTINQIPKWMYQSKKPHTLDSMAKRFTHWATLGHENNANGRNWYERWPGDWWTGMTFQKALEELSNARQKQRQPVDHDFASEINVIDQHLEGRYKDVDIRRRRYVVPRWYATTINARRRNIPKTIISRRRTYVKTWATPRGGRILKAGIRLYKLADDQRVAVSAKVSLCTWKRNTITWSSSRSLANVREDKIGYLKRMMARENRVKLTIKRNEASLADRKSVV